MSGAAVRRPGGGGLPAAAVAMILGVGLLASACQAQDGGGVPDERGSDAGTDEQDHTGPSPPAPTVSPGKVPPATGPGNPDPPAPVRLRGTLRAGVEPGCLLLDAEQGGSYLLLGEPRPRLPAGAEVEVEVSGVLEPEVRTTCQQGTPLRVTSLRER